MATNHIPVDELPYCETVRKWLKDRYKDEAESIWKKTVQNYNDYLKDLPDYGGKKNGHSKAIYGGLLIFALYPALPDEPPIEEMQEFAKSHNLLHMLPLMCNCDFFGISEIHGQLIRFGTCGNSDRCDYLVVGNKNKIASEYETVTDEQGFIVSRKK